MWVYEARYDKTNNVAVRPAKTRISLAIRPSWSESSLCAQWVAKDPSFLHADNEDFNQTGRMPRLIRVFAGRTLILLVLSCRGWYGYVVPSVVHLKFCFEHCCSSLLVYSIIFPICRSGAVARSEACSFGMQAAPSSIPTPGIFFRGDLVMKEFLRPFSFLRWYKKSSCQLLAKECALSTGKLPRRLAQEQCGYGNWPRPKWPKMFWKAVKQKSNQTFCRTAVFVFIFLMIKLSYISYNWAASSEFGTYCLCIRTVSPEPSLLAHISSEPRGTFSQKARSLAPLNGWACAVKICYDGMLEDTNSLDAAQ